MPKVTRLPVDPGVSGWAALLPDPPPPVTLEAQITSDWLVIGAGFAGLAAARRLSQLCPEDRITVLDAKRVGEGPAGRNSGFMIDLPHDLSSDDYGGAFEVDIAQTQDNRRAIDFAAEMAETFGLAPEAFMRSGKINAAASDAGLRHNESYAKHLAAMDEPHDVLSAGDMAEITGTTYYSGGLRTPGTAMIQPAMFVQGVAAGLRSNRLQIFENSPVIALARQGDTWRAQTQKGQVVAARVILAVNGHLQSFGHMKGRLLHVHTYASMTRPLSPEECQRLGGAPVWGVTPADPMGTTVRRISGQGGDRIVVRNRFTCDPTMDVGAATMARVAQDHQKAFKARFPMLADVEMAHVWGGRLCLSRNNVQAIEELEPGLFSACCQNGLGTAKGTLAGILAAELATGVASPALDRALKTRPSRLPPQALTTLVARMRIRRDEGRAGREL